MQSISDDKTTASRVLDLLAAYETSEEFERRKEANKVLHDSKQKGFHRLIKNGMIELKPNRPQKEDIRSIAKRNGSFNDEFKHGVLDGVFKDIHEGSTIGAACEKAGVTQRTLRFWAEKLGRKFPKYITPRMQFEIMDAVNSGEGFSAACKRHNVSSKTIKKKLLERGWEYKHNPKTKRGKFESIKK